MHNEIYYCIYWHNKLIRVFKDKDKALNCFEWFTKFLLKTKLGIVTLYNNEGRIAFNKLSLENNPIEDW